MKKINSISLWATLLTALCLVTGCKPKPHFYEPLQGDGNIVTRTLEVSDFGTIVLETPVELHYVESDKPFVRITGDSSLIAAMNPRVEHDKLILAVCWPQNTHAASDRNTMAPSQPLVVEASSRQLRSFGWNIKDGIHPAMFSTAVPDEVPSYALSQICMSADTGSYSSALLSMLRLEDMKLRVDLIYGTADSMRACYDATVKMRPFWANGYSTYYTLGSNYFDDTHVTNHSYFTNEDGSEICDTMPLYHEIHNYPETNEEQ